MCTLFAFLLNLYLIQICFCANLYKLEPATDLENEREEYTDFIAFPDNIDAHNHRPYHKYHHHLPHFHHVPKVNAQNNNNDVMDKVNFMWI